MVDLNISVYDTALTTTNIDPLFQDSQALEMCQEYSVAWIEGWLYTHLSFLVGVAVCLLIANIIETSINHVKNAQTKVILLSVAQGLYFISFWLVIAFLVINRFRGRFIGTQ